jgi:hypothetical protein
LVFFFGVASLVTLLLRTTRFQRDLTSIVANGGGAFAALFAMSLLFV